ncbi:hypothetical protein D3C85_1912520 [compost metagenome]
MDFNFNGWGNKQTAANDTRVAGTLSYEMETDYIRSALVGRAVASRWTATAPRSSPRAAGSMATATPA